MTKKTFISIAAGFKSRVVQLNYNDNISFEAKEAGRDAIRDCVEMFCAVAASENPRFDRVRFRAACGF